MQKIDTIFKKKFESTT